MSGDDKEDRKARREELATKARMLAAKGVKNAAGGAGWAGKATAESIPKWVPGEEKLTEAALKVGSKIPAPVAEGLQQAGRAGGIVIDAADAVNRVSKEDTAHHKRQRAVAVGLEKSVTVAPALMAMAGGTAPVALGIVAPAAAAYFIRKDADAVNDTLREYEKVDATFQPDFRTFNNLAGAVAVMKPKLKEAGATYDAKGNLDLSKSSNIRIVQKVLMDERKDRAADMDRNKPLAPRPVSKSPERGEYESAKMDVRHMDSALAELDVIRKGVAAAKKAEKEQGSGLSGVPAGAKPRVKGASTGM